MPIANVHGFTMVTLDFQYKEKYWKMISEHVHKKHGEIEIIASNEVIETLKECFQILCDEFKTLIEKVPEASFFIFTHNFHENSIDIWELQLQGIQIPINESDFATTRRVLKFILEHSCGIDLIGNPNFGQELFAKRQEYLQHLEELLYIGYQAIVISEYIARCQLFPCSISIYVENEVLHVQPQEPYNSLFKFIEADYPTHSHAVELYNTIPDLKQALIDNLGIDYDIVASVTNGQVENFNYRFGVMSMEQIIDYISNEYGYDKNNLKDFYEGLMVRKDNFMQIEESILKNQDIRRHTYRPILELKIDKKNYYIIGRNKWSESLTTLTTNALPFGIVPKEWSRHKGIRKFVSHLDNTHDAILEDPINEYLESQSIKHDSNVKSLEQEGDNIRVDIEGVGEIDILYLDETEKVIYVCECKHNRSRFDLNNWKRDYSNFKDKYENQLTKKVNWIKSNTLPVQKHFQILYEDPDLDISDYSVKGIFIINAPSVYMYNGMYRTYTIKDFKEKINGTFENVEFMFHNEDSGKSFHITYPYFDNLAKVLNSSKDIICRLMNLNTRELQILIDEIKSRIENSAHNNA